MKKQKNNDIEAIYRKQLTDGVKQVEAHRATMDTVQKSIEATTTELLQWVSTEPKQSVVGLVESLNELHYLYTDEMASYHFAIRELGNHVAGVITPLAMAIENGLVDPETDATTKHFTKHGSRFLVESYDLDDIDTWLTFIKKVLLGI